MNSLSAKEAKIIRAVYSVGKDAVDKNVNDYLVDKSRVEVRNYYEFSIESHEEVCKVFKTRKFVYGYCDYNKYKIVLHIDHVLHSTIEDIVDTILHECAHAVSHHVYNERGHGKYFRKVSRMFGSVPRATSKASNPSIAAKHTKKEKYKIIFLDDKNLRVTSVHECSRRLKNLSRRGMKNRSETVGKLWMTKMEDYNQFGLDFQKLAEVAFR
jgi:hypothetical protein